MAKNVCFFFGMCHFGTSILRLSYIYVYKGTRFVSYICHVTMSYPQGRRGIEGPEAMARGESTQGTAAAHAMFRTALFGCPGSSEEKGSKQKKQVYKSQGSTSHTMQETSPFSKRLSPRVMCLMCLDFFFWKCWEVPTSVFLKALDSTVS